MKGTAEIYVRAPVSESRLQDYALDRQQPEQIVVDALEDSIGTTPRP